MAEAPAVVVVTGSPARVRGKYGERGTERYLYLDAGAAMENVLLQAAALGLGGTPVGAFHDHRLRSLLGLEEKLPLVIIPLGEP
jgi:SagB-type dehydrogenase family enzyme